MPKAERNLDLNLDMTSFPSFKFGRKICDRTRFFPGQTNLGNQIEHSFANPKYIITPKKIIPSNHLSIRGVIHTKQDGDLHF